MEATTWVLVIRVISLFAGDFRLPPSRMRDLTEAGCLILAEEVRGPKTISYCYANGTPDPGSARPAKPARPICDECGPLPGRRRV